MNAPGGGPPDGPTSGSAASSISASAASSISASAAGQPIGQGRQRVLLVTGLSGGGKSSILRALEDLGYEAIDNPPLDMIEGLVNGGDPAAAAGRRIAVGVDARSRGFNAGQVLDTLARLRQHPAVSAELIYAWADEASLLRRYTETRRRHPLSPHGRVADGIAAEQDLTDPLRQAADLFIDTSDLPTPSLRRLIERRYGAGGAVRHPVRPGAAAGVIRIPRGPAPRVRHGFRCALSAQSALCRRVETSHRQGSQSRRLCRGRPGLPGVFRWRDRAARDRSCRASCKRAKNMQPSR